MISFPDLGKINASGKEKPLTFVDKKNLLLRQVEILQKIQRLKRPAHQTLTLRSYGPRVKESLKTSGL